MNRRSGTSLRVVRKSTLVSREEQELLRNTGNTVKMSLNLNPFSFLSEWIAFSPTSRFHMFFSFPPFG